MDVDADAAPEEPDGKVEMTVADWPDTDRKRFSTASHSQRHPHIRPAIECHAGSFRQRIERLHQLAIRKELTVAVEKERPLSME